MEDPDIDKEDEAACYQEAEVHIKAVVREPEKGTMEEDVEIEVVVTDADNDMEDPYPIDIIAPFYSKEHVASPVRAHVCSSPATSTMHHTDCSTVDFYGFEVSAHHKQYLEVIYNIEGPFWKNCIIQSPEWITSLLRLFGDALALSDRPWSLLSQDDLVRMVRSIEDAGAVGFNVHCLELLIEEARTMIASYDDFFGLVSQYTKVKEEIESVKGKLASLRNQRRELKGKMHAHYSAVGRTARTAFSFVSRVNYILVGSPI
ncbi:hypothetical protein J1N35_043284 [Gossypium stocksii]|uniref:Uncharacterized protein n=1 Tax=Gossypium stocksii TaxID=47602 RepID=A0A9D3U7A1_9ROSI|nr:hypothetical protein J1N35_043284 [Gossypium stocksii]